MGKGLGNSLIRPLIGLKKVQGPPQNLIHLEVDPSHSPRSQMWPSRDNNCPRLRWDLDVGWRGGTSSEPLLFWDLRFLTRSASLSWDKPDLDSR